MNSYPKAFEPYLDVSERNFPGHSTTLPWVPIFPLSFVGIHKRPSRVGTFPIGVIPERCLVSKVESLATQKVFTLLFTNRGNTRRPEKNLNERKRLKNSRKLTKSGDGKNFTGVLTRHAKSGKTKTLSGWP